MQRVFRLADSLRTDSLLIRSEMYLRHVMHTRRRGSIVRYIPGMMRLEHGERDYLSEAQMRLQFRPNGEADCKVVAYSSNARYLTADRLSSISDLMPRIYDAQLFSDRILGPLNRRNRRFYTYACLPDSIGDPPRSPVRILIRPRFSNEQLVSGFIDIEPQSGTVIRFSFRFRLRLQRITLTGETGAEGYHALLPARLRITSRFHFLGNVVDEVADIRASHSFSRPPQALTDLPRRDLTPLYLLRIDTTRAVTAPARFDSIRPADLDDPAAILKSLKSSGKIKRKEMPSDPEFRPLPYAHGAPAADGEGTNAEKRRFFNEQTQDFLLSSHAFPLRRGGRTRVKLPPVLTPSMMQWGHAKGFSLRTRIQCEYTPPAASVPTFSFSPGVGYSFKQKQLYYSLPLSLRFAPELDGWLRIESGGGSHAYNNRQAEELRERLRGVTAYDTLLHIIDHYGFHDYRDNYFKGDLSLSPAPGLTLTIGGRYHRRTLISWNELADRTGINRHLSSLAPRVEAEFTPAQYYYREGRRRVPLFSRWPTFLLSYERGYGMEGRATHYERLESSLRLRLPLYAMRTLFLQAGGGLYTRRGADCFLDYDYFRFDYMPAGWSGETAGELQLLDSRWYNESRHYLRLSSTYESPMLFLSRAPYLSRLILTERVYLNLLNVRALGIYAEAGYGISTHLLNLGAFLGIASHGHASFGCKFVLKFFEK